MEHCKLELSLPTEYERPQNLVHNHDDKTSAPDPRSWQISGDTKDLEIWTLETTEWLTTSKLSFSSRPNRGKRLGGLRVRPGMTMSTHTFACPSDSIQSFELFCISPGCRIDVWQDRKTPVVGKWKLPSTGVSQI